MIEKDLADQSLEWKSFAPAGAEQPAEMVLLFASEDATSRTVLVRFAAGWERTAKGNQPAGEEMLVLEGALSMSGSTATPGSLLVAEPHATRADTGTRETTRAVVWFSGAAGGWAEGPADAPGTISVAEVSEGVIRPAGVLPGSVEVRDGADLGTFPTDVDVVWPQLERWVHLSAGEVAPAGSGPAVIRHWS